MSYRHLSFVFALFLLMSGLNANAQKYAVESDGTAAVVSSTGCPANLIIPDSVTISGTKYAVTKISAQAFQNCKTLKKLTIPKSIKKIGPSAFKGCSNLQEVNYNAIDCNFHEKRLTQSPNDIYNNPPFEGCTAIYRVNIGPKVKSIPNCMFKGCNFFSIDIPDNVKTICAYAFAESKSLNTFTLGKGLENLGRECFGNCCSAATVNYNCEELDFYYDAFYGTGVYEVTIGSKVMRLPEDSFSECDEIWKIIIEAKNPPLLLDNCFKELRSDCLIVVPNASITNYKSSAQWGRMGKIMTRSYFERNYN